MHRAQAFYSILYLLTVVAYTENIFFYKRQALKKTKKTNPIRVTSRVARILNDFSYLDPNSSQLDIFAKTRPRLIDSPSPYVQTVTHLNWLSALPS
jgi:hypothetical protein